MAALGHCAEMNSARIDQESTKAPPDTDVTRTVNEHRTLSIHNIYQAQHRTVRAHVGAPTRSYEARQGETTSERREDMIEPAQQTSAEQEPRPDAETVGDLPPREDELAELKGGFNPQPDPLASRHRAS